MPDWLIYIPYAILVFGVLVLVHEMGHFTVAKLVGVQVYEFSIGFGPRLVGFRKGETAYNLRAVPLGGFVRMAGMDPEEDRRESGDTEGAGENNQADSAAAVVAAPEKSFANKTVLQRMAIIAAGPVMNFVLAVVLFAIIIWVSGVPVNKIDQVIPDRPAAEVGIKSGDTITRIGDQRVGTWEDILQVIHASPEKQLQIEVQRDQETKVFEVKPEKDPETQWGLIGITPQTRKPGVFESLKQGSVKTYEMLSLTFVFIGKMISKEMPVQLSGPVRITYELGKAAEMGFIFLVNIAGFLSLQIGLFNLLPIPALDGSRLVFLGWEGIRGTPVDQTKENFIHMVGLMFLLFIMVVITYQDIVQMLS
ncbi:RIP metalloprotease RseP [Phosphitispora fastidiosa]|uniref:RIP metalloprotease RseP n=1 Tax=Phosphitispora fastidiosa TaxID=2837202 RepID=UPI001E3032AB|nr:RIP metalloprotease RseP [Phosphitispora fastidiosa]MBU7008309.1 regulator of sigma E protease [Phosphitispora fastidiosa]